MSEPVASYADLPRQPEPVPCLGHGCRVLVISATARRHWCSYQCFHRSRSCHCLSCASLRAERGWRPLDILIGRERFPALPLGRRLP